MRKSACGSEPVRSASCPIDRDFFSRIPAIFSSAATRMAASNQKDVNRSYITTLAGNVIRKLPPVWFIRALNSFRSGLLKLHRMTFPASVVMYERFTSFWVLAAIRVAAELDIAGILEKKSLSIGQLAERTGSDPQALFRMMRALSSENIFKRTKDGLYKNTKLSKVLTEGKGSLRYTLMQHLGTINWTIFNDLSYSIKTGKSAFSKVYGMKIYEYLVGTSCRISTL